MRPVTFKVLAEPTSGAFRRVLYRYRNRRGKLRWTLNGALDCGLGYKVVYVVYLD